MDYKWLSLAVLVLQNTCSTLLMRYTRTQSGVIYLSSIAVVCDESIKMIVCLGLLALAYLNSTKNQEEVRPVFASIESGVQPDELPLKRKVSLAGFIQFFKQEVLSDPAEFFKMCIPAICYALQKNALYLAVSNLDAAVFQVAYQGKVLTTATFSWLILRKRLTRTQIMALVSLALGLAVVQVSTTSTDLNPNTSIPTQDPVLGISAVLFACCTSGFASVYIVWALKRSSSPANHSIWVRNIQLGSFALSAAIVTAITKDLEIISSKGPLVGFTGLVWTVVALEACGGIIVSLVIKYADTILKTFATAVSIVSAATVSWLFFGFHANFGFVLGSSIVLAAVWMYNKPPEHLHQNGQQGKEMSSKTEDFSPVVKLVGRASRDSI